MTRSRTIRAAAALLAATLVATGAAGPAAAQPNRAHDGKGDFAVGTVVVFGPPEDVKGNKCLLTVTGTLFFTGSLEGAATGTTRALVFAPCAEATAMPPGSYFDVFTFVGDFEGTVAGDPAAGTLTYSGVTRAGGDIDALITLKGGDGWARLRTTDAVVLQGGSYTGKVKPAG